MSTNAKISFLVFTLSLLFCFQNCSSQFEILDTNVNSLKLSSQIGEPQTPVILPGTPTTPVPPNTTPLVWERLEIAPHRRFYPVAGNQVLTDSAKAQVTTSVPFMAFSYPVLSENGMLYYWGGGHGNYAGNDINICDLSRMNGKTMNWIQLYRPHVPAQQELGGGSDVVYKETVPYLSDWTQWEPYSFHGYGRVSFYPGLGVIAMINGALGVQSDGSIITSYKNRATGLTLVYRDEITGKFQTLGEPRSGMNDQRNMVPLSDYDDYHDSMLVFGNYDENNIDFWDVNPKRGYRYVRRVVKNTVGANFGADTVAHYLENGVHLILAKNESNYKDYVFIYDHKNGAIQDVTIPSNVQAILKTDSSNLVAAVDKSKRRIYWAQSQNGTVSLWWSSFDTPSAWNDISTASAPKRPIGAEFGNKSLWFWNNQLWFTTVSPENQSDAAFYRIRIN